MSREGLFERLRAPLSDLDSYVASRTTQKEENVPPKLEILLAECHIFGLANRPAPQRQTILLRDIVESSKAFHGLQNQFCLLKGFLFLSCSRCPIMTSTQHQKKMWLVTILDRQLKYEQNT